MTQSSTSFDIRDTVDYTLIHDVKGKHWGWFIEAAAPEDGDVILDCGCGYGDCTGKLLTLCRKSCFIVDLLDESYVQLERAKKALASAITGLGDSPSSRSALNYINKTAEAYSLKSTRRYDKIFLKMVLHEIPKADQKAFLDSLFVMLKPGGVLIVWDLALNPLVAPFFRKVVGEKDRLLNFQTLMERRYFLTEREFLDIAKESSFKAAETTALFDCDFYSKRRVVCEFKNQQDKYNCWIKFIKTETTTISSDVKPLLHLTWEADAPPNEHVHFVIQRAIWRLRKHDCLSVISALSIAEPFDSHLAPSSSCPKLVEHFQKAVCRGIIDFKVHELLPGHKGLVRVTTFEPLRNGRLELCKDGTDYIYFYDEADVDKHEEFVSKLLESYYGHMAYVYDRKKHDSVNGRTLTDFLNESGQKSANASWLRILRPLCDAQTNTATIEIALFEGSVKIADDVLIIQDYGAATEALSKDYPYPENVFECEKAFTIASKLTSKNGQSVDSVAQQTVTSKRTPPYSHAKAKLNWKHNRLRECPVDALIGFAHFIESSGLKYGCYVLPPALLDSPQGRAMPAAVFFSSDRVLTHREEQVLLAFTSKVWTEIRGFQLLSQSHTFLNTAYREEILNKSAERAFFVKDILFPILCGNDTCLDPRTLSKKRESTERDIFDEWAIAQGRAFARSDLQDLVQYVHSEDEGLSASERLALKGVQHEIGANILASVSLNALLERIARGKEIAQRGGRWLAPIASLLESAETDVRTFSVKESALVKCKRAFELSEQLISNDRVIIEQLCCSFQHATTWSDTFCYCPLTPRMISNDKTKKQWREYPLFRFSLSDFESAVTALRHNAIRFQSTSYSLRYRETTKGCVLLTWVEAAKVSWNFDSFKQAVLESAIRGGIHRGLPCVILFGLESQAKKIEVLCNGYWNAIWPLDGETTNVEEEFKTLNYGIRITI